MNMAKPQRVGLSAARLSRIGACMQSHVERGTAAGVITLIACEGKVAHLECSGMDQWNGAVSTRWWNDPAEDLIGLMMVQTLQGDHMPQIGQAFRVLAYQAIDD